MPKGIYNRPVRALTVMGNHIIVTLTQGQISMIDIDDIMSVTGVNWSAQRCRDKR